MQSMVNRLLPSSSFDAIRQFAKLSKDVSFEKKTLWNVFPYSFYAYGLINSCNQAKKLGLSEVSALELGVAGGNGLLALEKHSKTVEKLTGVSIRTFGFDTGEGLPPPSDYKDLPYFFGRGDFRMNEELLRERLTKSELVLGDVTTTFPKFVKESDCPPIAFVAFDLDFYHPTKAVLDCAAKNRDKFIPRAFLYFDNTVGNSETLYNEFTGELLAISEFNAEQKSVKVAKDRSLRAYNINFIWFHKIYVLHNFIHEMYASNIGNQSEDSLSLRL